ncbi:hypothetical protein [Morganella morganii]|uniref:hypothetical protein n=1 Tax=Morganella morganii TaxID=582 RepID=UPI0023679574|nr:hypothetical protein [Morganella morganii]
MNREKNSIYFKVLISPYLLYVASYVVVVLFFIFYQWNITPFDVLEIKLYISVLIFFVCVFLFIKDRSFLIENGFYCPSWIWFLFLPIYIYKRQKYNDSGFECFWLFVFINLFLPLYNDDILKGIISMIVVIYVK